MASSVHESVVNMKQQIMSIVACTQPYEVKKTLLEYCCKTYLTPMENEAYCSILKHAIQWIFDGSEDLLVESGKMILIFLVENKKMSLVSFFDEDMMLSLLKMKSKNVSRFPLLDILSCIFPHLKSSSTVYPKLCKVVSHHVTSWLQMNDTVQHNGRVAEFLISFTDCLPSGKDEQLAMNHLLIQCLGKTKTPKVPKEEMIDYFEKVSSICKLLYIIWQKDNTQSIIFLSVKQCFEILSNPEYESTVALAHLTNYVPDDVITSMINEVTMSTSIPDQELTIGISKMIQWLVWPKKTKVLHWILSFFKCLVKARKKNILENVILNQILQVFSRVFMPVVREINFIVLVNMLMSSLDLPTAFLTILPFVPNLLARLRSEKTEKSITHLKGLGELMYTLMHIFPDNGTLYTPLLLALKDIPKPSSEKINYWLQSADISFKTDENKTSQPRILTPERICLLKGTRKTGLVNLGNTCYMNSILQCLLMLDMFRNMLMPRRVSPTRCPIMYALQELFTFLVMSKRDAVAPERFVHQSRPPWFPSRTQQDCCEFVHYMMDRLEEEDKSLLQHAVSSNVNNIIEENFKGVLRVTYTCLKCGNESHHKEAFTDILLAFPDRYCTKEANTDRSTDTKQGESVSENPKSLKGGNQVRKFQNSRAFTDESFEGTKESVSNVESSTLQQNNPAVGAKRDQETFTIHEMLDYFMMPEKLSGNNQYFCDECNENVDGERRVQISELPKYLMLVLKRFSFDVKLQTKPKLLHIVQYPEELTFCSVGESIKLVQNDYEDQLSKKSILEDGVKDDGWEMDTSKPLHPFKLRSVVVHSGRTCEAGHYYSYALDTQSKGTMTTPQWYCFNDERTYETSYQTFIEHEKNMLTDTTYILIYDQLTGVHQSDENCEFVAAAEMIERVELDNTKYCQERNRLSSSPQRKEKDRSEFDDDKDDKSPPPGSCGANGSSFSVPGNRFIF